jgi:hypothetical protein
MQIKRWLFVVLLLIAAVIGAGGMMVSFAVNHSTSTDAFCTGCHTMAVQFNDPYFQKSAHRNNKEGVRPSCGIAISRRPTGLSRLTFTSPRAFAMSTSNRRTISAIPKSGRHGASRLSRKRTHKSAPGTASPAAAVTMPAQSSHQAMPGVSPMPCWPRAA